MKIDPLPQRAMLLQPLDDTSANLNGSLQDRLREYLAFGAEDRGRCTIQTIAPVVFNEELPARYELNSEMIDSLVERLGFR
jgi:hypothetical protein